MAQRASDVLILGAGPAGLVAAGFLGRAGHRVTVVDPGGPAPGPLLLCRPGQEVLGELGLLGSLAAHSSARHHRELVLLGAHEEVALGPELVDVVAVARETVVAHLRELAVGVGVTLLPGFCATVPLWDERRVVGVRARGPVEQEVVLTAGVTIDATGAASFLPASLGHLLPRRGRRRARLLAAAPGEERLVLGLAADAWVTGSGGGGPWWSATVRIDEVDDAPDDLVRVLERLGDLPRPQQTRVLARDVGARHRAMAGEGWIAVGDAAGCAAPGALGAASAGLVLAASAAWEADIALRRGRPFGAAQAGATITLARQAGYLEGLLDRALNRAARVGMLRQASASAGRRRALAELLQAELAGSGGRLRRIAYLWWLDHASRRLEKRRGRARSDAAAQG